MSKQRISSRGSNWETIAFLLINKILVGGSRFFTRSELMNLSNIDNALKFLETLGHKKSQSKPVETLQRTIQNMRDKGFIIFHGNGEYELSEEGQREMRIRIDQLKPKES